MIYRKKIYLLFYNLTRLISNNSCTYNIEIPAYNTPRLSDTSLKPVQPPTRHGAGIVQRLVDSVADENCKGWALASASRIRACSCKEAVCSTAALDAVRGHDGSSHGGDEDGDSLDVQHFRGWWLEKKSTSILGYEVSDTGEVVAYLLKRRRLKKIRDV